MSTSAVDIVSATADTAEGTEGSGVDGVESFGYYLLPPVWLGESLTGPSAESRGAWDQIERTELPERITAFCFRIGLFAFNLARWPPGAPAPRDPATAQERVRWRSALMNTHLACLYTASKRRGASLMPMLVTPNDIVHVHNNGVVSASGMLAITGLLRTPSVAEPSDWRLSRSTVISTNVIRESYNVLASILDTAPGHEILPLIDLALRAAVAHMGKTFDAALIQAWGVVERILTDKWDRYLGDNRTREALGEEVFINAERKEFLSGRDFTISIVIEALSLLDVIPFEMYRRLGPVRKARNRWMHELRPITVNDSFQALQLAFDLLRFAYGIDLDPVPDVMFASGV
jgi:hypothetical protein